MFLTLYSVPNQITYPTNHVHIFSNKIHFPQQVLLFRGTKYFIEAGTIDLKLNVVEKT